MRVICLPTGEPVYVDDKDFPLVSRFKWRLCDTRTGYYYAQANVRQPGGQRTTVRMHRVILNAPCGVAVKHVDGNGLNNIRSNLISRSGKIPHRSLQWR